MSCFLLAACSLLLADCWFLLVYSCLFILTDLVLVRPTSLNSINQLCVLLVSQWIYVLVNNSPFTSPSLSTPFTFLHTTPHHTIPPNSTSSPIKFASATHLIHIATHLQIWNMDGSPGGRGKGAASSSIIVIIVGFIHQRVIRSPTPPMAIILPIIVVIVVVVVVLHGTSWRIAGT